VARALPAGGGPRSHRGLSTPDHRLILKYLARCAQGAAFAIVMMLAKGTAAETLLAFMIGVSFGPSSFWWFL